MRSEFCCILVPFVIPKHIYANIGEEWVSNTDWFGHASDKCPTYEIVSLFLIIFYFLTLDMP